MLNSDYIISRAGEIYQELKKEKGFDVPPEIPNDQIRALCEILCDEINKELEKTKT